MGPLSSSCRGTSEDGRHWSAYPLRGRMVRVYDSFRTALVLERVARDELLGTAERGTLLVRLLLVSPEGFMAEFGDDAASALRELLGEVFGIGEGNGRRLVDFDEDAERLVVTMRQAYGLGEEYEELPFREVMALVALSPADTPMGRAIHYRTAKRPKATKWNKEEVRGFDRAVEHYRLKGKADPIGDANASASAAFDRLRKASGDGRRRSKD